MQEIASLKLFLNSFEGLIINLIIVSYVMKNLKHCHEPV